MKNCEITGCGLHGPGCVVSADPRRHSNANYPDLVTVDSVEAATGGVLTLPSG